ncbi:hypothetical protein DDD_0254 [Nonlabens dokdonensis DSW-6]|uniref:Uncharacterized protein n=1 Tax=Nonlabens dokdonensis (strain DSM 17205 / KCTC 12402 / DSW-6) TaxID=592029 RepID=L7W6I1_NONDD|nr:hypothetical protein DDD_0254 [Nonlabens dokdonensis DSW-6]
MPSFVFDDGANMRQHTNRNSILNVCLRLFTFVSDCNF